MGLTVEDLKGKSPDEIIAQAVSLSEEIDQLKQKQEGSVPEVKTPEATPAPEVSKPEVAVPAVEAPKPEAPKVDEKQFNEVKNAVKTLQEENATLRSKSYEQEVDKLCSEFEVDGKPPACIAQAREIMKKFNAPQTFKFNEKDAEGKDVEISGTFADAIISLMEAIPSIQLGEEVVPVAPNGSSDANTQKSGNDEVKKYMEDNKCNYKVAILKLAESGKLNIKTNVPKE